MLEDAIIAQGPQTDVFKESKEQKASAVDSQLTDFPFLPGRSKISIATDDISKHRQTLHHPSLCCSNSPLQ